MDTREPNRQSEVESTRRTQGQLAVVVPLSLVMAVGGSLMWGYVSLIQSQAASVHGVSDINSAVRTVYTRIKSQLSGAYVPCNDPNTSSQILKDFRNFEYGSTSTLNWKWSSSAVASPSPAPSIIMVNCFLGDTALGQAADEGKNLQSLDIEVAQIGNADLSSMSARVQVTVNGVSKPTYSSTGSISTPAHTVNLSHQLLLRAGRPVNYVFMALPDPTNVIGPGNEIIHTDQGATAEFMSSVFDADYQSFSAWGPELTAIVPIPAAGTPPSVVFDRPFEARNDTLTYDTTAAGSTMDSVILSQIFTHGLSYNVFGHQYGSHPVPFDKNIPFVPMAQRTSAPTVSTWATPGPAWDAKDFTQILDYYTVYRSNAFPIPAIQDGGFTGALLDAGTYPAPAPSSIYTSGISTTVVDPGSIVQTVFRSAHALVTESIPDGTIMPSLKTTCGSDLLSIPTFVHQRLDSITTGNSWFTAGATFSNNLTVTFDSAAGCGGTSTSGCDPVLCGLIAADTVTFNLTQNRTYAFYGTIVARQIIIHGAPGITPKIYFVSPVDGILAPGVDLGTQTIPNMLAQFQALGSGTAFNFFVPFFFKGAIEAGQVQGGSGGLLPLGAADYLQPCMSTYNYGVGPYSYTRLYCMKQQTKAPNYWAIDWWNDTFPVSITVTQ